MKLEFTTPTAYNLDELAAVAGLKTPGRVVDKLAREKMLALKGQKEK